MDTPSGAALHSDDDAARSEAARLMGKSRTEAKVTAARANVAKAAEARRGKPMSEEHRQKLREAYQARRMAQGLDTVPAEPTEKRRPGRPRKQETPEEGTAEPAVKRGKGRPRKDRTQ
jgi:hypothetical protein